MKRKLVALLLAVVMILSVAACGGKKDDGGAKEAGFVNGKFETKRTITVEVFDRDQKTPADNNYWTEWIQKQMLEKYNVEVVFKAVPRWTEKDQLNNLLSAGDAPDICYTYDYPTILTYAEMDGITDLAPLVKEYKDLLPNLYSFVGEGLTYDQDPETGVTLAIEGIRCETQRSNIFVRQDWLDKLNMKAPTTLDEFHDMLVAFKNNADKLLGADASQMIPMMLNFDVGWTAAPVIESFIDPKITDKEYYINGYDSRNYTQNGAKEGTRVLNKWYNEGLIWKDFALYGSGDSTGDDLMKAGYVGAFMHNYDYPFRSGADGINALITAKYGEGARFVAINCFKDSTGKYTKYQYAPCGSDRKIFFPKTNDEPLASLLYLDFISSGSAIEYLQIGEEGINHKKVDGGVQFLTVEEANIKYNQNSPKNIDYTMTCNGFHLSTDEMTRKSFAYSYSDVNPDDVVNAVVQADLDSKFAKHANVGKIAAEGEGTDLDGKRDAAYDTAVTCKPEEFDKVWDEKMKEYLNAGGQAIINERKAAWEKVYGNKDNID